MLFDDRREAGRKLGERLSRYAGRPDLLVLALPRGGVPVGYEVAQALSAPLDVFVVRKLGVPQFKELAMGAIASGGIRVLNEEVISGMGIPPGVVEAVADAELKELEAQQRLYCGDRKPSGAAGRLVILVDDGLATGATMRAAVKALKMMQPAGIIAAAPLVSPDGAAVLRPDVDDLVALSEPSPFYGVGAWYHDFSAVSDDEVRELLEKNALQQAALARTRGQHPEHGGLAAP